MADGQDQVTAMVQDPDFMKLSPSDQQAALAAHDPMFGKVGPADIARFVQAHQGARAPVAQMGIPAEQMQTSSAPGYVRGATSALPVAGGIGGAVLGAPAFGGGAIVGGALGAGAGVQGKLLADRAIFGPDETSPTSKEGLTETGIGAVIGGASEIPGAIAQGYGNVLLKQLAQAKAPSQIGDVLQAFKNVNPVAGTKAGLTEGLEMANKQLGAKLGNVLRSATGTVQFDSTITQNALQQAAIEDAGFARTTASGRVVSDSRVTNMVKDAIAAAKSNAGITGNTATAEQLNAFQQEIQDKAFKVGMKNPTVGAVVQRIMKQNLYRDAGGAVRFLTNGQADPILQQMTDVYAGLSALKNAGSLGKTGPISVSAALNPRITAILSPGVTAAGTAAASEVSSAIKSKTKSAVLPILLLLLYCSSLFAQTSSNGRIMEGALATRPTVCANADVFIANDSDPPLSYVCGNTNNWQAFGGSGGSGVPGGFNTMVQYNSGGLFQGDANFEWDFVNKNLNIAGNILAKGPIPSVNVMAFGCKGIGNTFDDTSCIQAAINYACTHNLATIEFPPPPQYYSVTQTQTGTSTTQPIFYGCAGPSNPAFNNMYFKGSNGNVNRPQFSTSGAAIVALSGASPNPAPVFLLQTGNTMRDLNIQGRNEAVAVGAGSALSSASNAIYDCGLSIPGAFGSPTSTLPNSPLVIYDTLWFWMRGGEVIANGSTTIPTITLLQDGGQTDGQIFISDIVEAGGGINAHQILANQSPLSGLWVFRNVLNEELTTPFLFFDDDGTHHWGTVEDIVFDSSGTSDGTPASFMSLNSTGMSLRGVTFLNSNSPSNVVTPLIQVFAGAVQNVYSTGNSSQTKIIDGSGNLLGAGMGANGLGWDYFGNANDETFIDINNGAVGQPLRVFTPSSTQALLGISQNGFVFNNGTANGWSGQLIQSTQETIDVGFAKYLPPTNVATAATTGGSLSPGTYHYVVVAADSSSVNTFSAYSNTSTVVVGGANNAVNITWTPSGTSAATPGGYVVIQTDGNRSHFVSGASSSSDTDNGTSPWGCCYSRANTNSLVAVHRFTSSQLGVNTTSPAYNLDVNGTGHFATYFDITETAAPANPPASTCRIYDDSTTHNVTGINHSGSGCLTSGGGGGSSFQVNGTALTSSTTVNFENSATFNGLTFTFSNPSAGNVQLGASGTLSIAGGGTGQTTQTLAFDALSPLTTQGDLILYNGTHNVRLGIGTNTQVLTSNGTTASWQTPSTVTGSGAATQCAFWSSSSAITGSANCTYSASSGISLIQGANAADMIYGKRATDTSPTGNFFHFQNAAAATDMAALDVNGNLSIAQQLTTGTGATTHFLKIPEGTTAGGATGFDVFSADSTSHTMQISENNGTFFTAAVWSGTTPTAHGVALVHPSIFPLINWTGAGTAGQCLISNGASADPTYQSCGVPTLTSTHIFVGNGSNVATDVALSGDATMANTGAMTLNTVNSNTGTSTPATITVNAKGLVTAVLSIADVTTTVGTTAIGANACTSATTVTMTGVTTTMTFSFTANADVSGVTGWGSTGGLVIDAWPTSNTLNYKVCNQTASSITPSASVTFNVSAR